MNEDLIKLVEEKIKNCEDTKLTAEMRIISLRKKIEEAERDLFRANNVLGCLQAALKNLVDAHDRDEDIAAIRPVQEEEKPADYLGSLKIPDEAILEPEEEPQPGKTAICKTKIITAQDITDDEIQKQKEARERTERKEKLTPEERTKESLNDADQVIAREKKRQEQKDKGWPLCTVCNSNRTSPANKKGICTPCQTKRKTDRPYKRRGKKEEDLPF